MGETPRPPTWTVTTLAMADSPAGSQRISIWTVFFSPLLIFQLQLMHDIILDSGVQHSD